jgi:uncharacterized protein (DUF58 family)
MKLFKRPMVSNRCVYASVHAVLLVSAWIYGERLLYIALIVFSAMPVVSFITAFVLLRVLMVSQTIPDTVVKNDTGVITLRFRNPAPVFFGNIQCVFHTDDFAVETEEGTTLWLKTLETATQEIPFRVKYRGIFQVGIKSVQAVDMMGLFRLKRRFYKKTEIHVLPRIVDMSGFPLAMNVLTEAHSRYDIKDEDYATISDIRPYLPTDSIKRVHWKLTAKRNEWLVKNFQSNVLNKVTVIFDSLRLHLRYKEQIILEDRIIETAMGLARFCLRKGMPVNFMTGEGHTVSCQNAAMFETVYTIGSHLIFKEKPPYNPQSMLTQCLNDAAGYVNALILTPRLDGSLYERIVNGMNNGHYIAVLYFPTTIKDPDSEEIFQLLSEGGAPCFRVTEESLVDEDV